MGAQNSSAEFLDADEIQNIVTSWTYLKRNLHTCGITLFLTFFGEFPENMKYFKELVDQKDHVKTDQYLVNHCIKVMRAIGKGVENVKNRDDFNRFVVEHASIHIDKKITRKSYEEFIGAYTNMLSQELGPRYSNDIGQAWEKFLRYLFVGSMEYTKKLLKDLPGPSMVPYTNGCGFVPYRTNRALLFFCRRKTTFNLFMAVRIGRVQCKRWLVAESQKQFQTPTASRRIPLVYEFRWPE